MPSTCWQEMKPSRPQSRQPIRYHCLTRQLRGFGTPPRPLSPTPRFTGDPALVVTWLTAAPCAIQAEEAAKRAQEEVDKSIQTLGDAGMSAQSEIASKAAGAEAARAAELVGFGFGQLDLPGWQLSRYSLPFGAHIAEGNSAVGLSGGSGS